MTYPTNTVVTPYPSQAIEPTSKAVTSRNWIQFGLPLKTPSVQTLLPLINQRGRVYGFFPIARTTFQGTETTFTVAPGETVPITTVSIPLNVVRDRANVDQYMAMVIDDVQERQKVWVGYETLVGTTPQALGYDSFWSAPTVTIMHRFNRGVFLNALARNLDATVPPGLTPVPPNPQSGTITWEASMNEVIGQNCPFIDFSWTKEFMLSPVVNPDLNNSVIPLSIEIVSNPSGVPLKAVLVTNSMDQTIYPGGGVTFDTMRIMQLGTVPPGTYTFTFNVFYSYASSATTTQKVPATLTLTVK